MFAVALNDDEVYPYPLVAVALAYDMVAEMLLFDIAREKLLLEMSDSVPALFENSPNELLIVCEPGIVDVTKEIDCMIRMRLNCRFCGTMTGMKNAEAVDVPIAPPVWLVVPSGY